MEDSKATARDWDGLDRRAPERIDDEARARRLLAKYRAGGHDAAASRDALVLQFKPLVQKQARQFLMSNVPYEDLVQEGFLGLMNGIERYDPTRGAKLITYATHHIDGHLRHFLRDRVQLIKEPAWLQEAAQKVRKETEALTQQLGRVPSESEIASSLGLTEKEVSRISSTRSVFAVTSLDEAQETGAPAAHVSDESQHTNHALPIEDRVVLEGALVRLKEIEQKVLYSFYYEDRSQTDIAQTLGVSNNYISHILKNSARKLQQMFRSDAVREAALQHERQRRRINASGGQVTNSDMENAPPSVVDGVTGLYTKSYFMDRLDEELSRAIRHDLALSIIRVIVAGELPQAALFAQVASSIKSCMRRSDVVARTDEAEITTLLPHTGKTREIVCGRVRDRLVELIEHLPKTCTLKMGTSSYPEYRYREQLLSASEPKEIIAPLTP